MPLANAVDVNVIAGYRLLSFQDLWFDETEEISLTSWISTGSAKVIITTERDVMAGTLRLESWDEEAAFDPAAWQRAAIVGLTMPSGQVGTADIARESMPLEFGLPAPGRYRVRVAVSEHPAPPASPGTPDWQWPAPSVTALAQFWRA